MGNDDHTASHRLCDVSTAAQIDVAVSSAQRLSDRYELAEILGVGGTSEVHLARDLRLHRDVAIKILRADLARDPRFRRRFDREARSAAALNHPAIVATYDVGETQTPTGPVPFIVMEYLNGVTLRDIIHDEQEPVSQSRAIAIIAQVCQALHYSHQQGVVHRDIKPANVMINATGAVTVMDFGIARVLTEAHNVTQTEAVIGTVQYLCPEQARGQTIDARSDVYSLGCVFYELLAGVPPFLGDSPIAVVYQHVREDPVPPSQHNRQIPADLDAVVLKALAKNPDNRYQSADEMRADLLRVQQGQRPQAPKVFTDAQRASMLAPPPASGHTPAAEHTGSGWPTDRRRGRSRSGRRWMITAASLAVLLVATPVAVNPLSVGPPDLHIPNLAGQPVADALTTLQNQGFQARTQQHPDSTVPPNHVINTEPNSDTPVKVGDEITLNVSTGPQQHPIPDVSGLTYTEAITKLRDAGFRQFTPTRHSSPILPKDVVIGTNPRADQTSALTTKITVILSSGPPTTPVPDVAGQTVELATKNLNTLGFLKILTAPIDSPRPSGEITDTTPPAGTTLGLDTAITLHVSTGQQFLMPDLTDMFWTDAEPRLRALGWTGTLDKGPNITAGDQNHNKILKQNPPPGTAINFHSLITLRFGA